MLKMVKNIKVVVSAIAQDVNAEGLGFLLVNAGDTPVYIHDKSDGEAATTDDFCIPAGAVVEAVLCCDTLSVIGSAAGDLRVLLVRDWS